MPFKKRIFADHESIITYHLEGLQIFVGRGCDNASFVRVTFQRWLPRCFYGPQFVRYSGRIVFCDLGRALILHQVERVSADVLLHKEGRPQKNMQYRSNFCGAKLLFNRSRPVEPSCPECEHLTFTKYMATYRQTLPFNLVNNFPVCIRIHDQRESA